MSRRLYALATLGLLFSGGGCATATRTPPTEAKASEATDIAPPRMAVQRYQSPASTQPTTASADSCTGDWGWVFDFTPGLLVGAAGKFVQAGNQINGTVRWGANNAERKISDGTIEGKRIRFNVTDTFEGVTVYTYNGVMDGDKIRGTVAWTWTRPGEQGLDCALPWRAARFGKSDYDQSTKGQAEFNKKYGDFLDGKEDGNPKSK